ncbi:uncharacterized protein LOC128462073 [Pleuronectes platessa]|uniref:uncharacterized protein LOC128462073 n=1 Tax=Pleuronectes platessa TaxID=8262 RepID=UPI00232A42FB|nr:uncharacterized protein LOC128462073 [Pleuronectes platessa]
MTQVMCHTLSYKRELLHFVHTNTHRHTLYTHWSQSRSVHCSGRRRKMKLIHDSILCLLHLLLLAELFVPSSSRPANPSSLCGMLGPMIHQVEKLVHFSKTLHGLSEDDELLNTVGNKLQDLPHVQHTAAHFNSLKLNESLSQLFQFTQSFRLHMDWLKTEKHNFSLPSGTAEDASTHLLLLSTHLTTSLQRMGEDAPRPPAPSLPVVSSAFDVLQCSIEISERLRVFGNWSKRVLHHLRRLSRCRRH